MTARPRGAILFDDSWKGILLIPPHSKDADIDVVTRTRVVHRLRRRRPPKHPARRFMVWRTAPFVRQRLHPAGW